MPVNEKSTISGIEENAYGDDITISPLPDIDHGDDVDNDDGSEYLERIEIVYVEPGPDVREYGDGDYDEDLSD